MVALYVARLDMSADEAHALLVAFRVFAADRLAPTYLGVKTITFGVSIGTMGQLELECETNRVMNMGSRCRVLDVGLGFVKGWQAAKAATTKGV